MDTTKSNNKYTMKTLYGIGNIIFDNLSDNLTAFQEYKSKYIPALVVTFRGRRADAMAFPNSEELSSIHEVLRNQLKPLGRNCCKDFQKLKGYIEDAFPASEWKAQYKAAGGNYYAEAFNYNWSSLTEMNSMKGRFITNNSVALLANNNMNAGFPLIESDNDSAYTTKLGLFTGSRQTSTGRNAKVNANNLSYSDMSSIASDSLKLDGVDDAFLKQFDLSALADIVSPKGSASLKLIVKLDVAFTFIEGAIVTIQADGEPAITLTTDVNGEVHFLNVDPYRYTITITAAGNIPMSFEKDVDTGVNAHKDVLMELVPPPVAPPAAPVV